LEYLYSPGTGASPDDILKKPMEDLFDE